MRITSHMSTMAIIWRGYLVIVGGVLVHLTLGTVYTYGNLTPYMTSYIRKHSSPSDLEYGDSVWIFALSAMGQGLSMSFGGLMERRFGPCITTLMGSWFMSIGVLLTHFTVQYSFATAVLTYGLMFGLGIGIAYAVPIACAMKWMPERKGLVAGFVVAGFGGGAFIFDQIQTKFINPHNLVANETVKGEKYFPQEEVLKNVPDVFLLLGGCYAALQLLGCLLLKNPSDYKEGDESDSLLPNSIRDEKPEMEKIPSLNTDEDSVNFLQNDRTMGPREMLKSRGFYILWFIFLLNGQGVSFISSLYKAYGQTFITNDAFLTWVGALSAVCNAVGRIMWGHLADVFSFKVAMMCLCCMFTILMLTLGLTKLAGEVMFLIWVCLLFLTFSGNYSLMPTATVRSFGQKYYGMNYGLVFTSQVVTAPISAILTSDLKGAIGWYGMFYLVSAFSFCSFILTISFNVKMLNGKEV